jgi:hypothetical protein
MADRGRVPTAILLLVEARAQFLDRLVKLYADAASHADHHRLAEYRGVNCTLSASSGEIPSPRWGEGGRRPDEVRRTNSLDCARVRCRIPAPLSPQAFLRGFLRVFRCPCGSHLPQSSGQSSEARAARTVPPASNQSSPAAPRNKLARWPGLPSIAGCRERQCSRRTPPACSCRRFQSACR